MIAPIFCRMQIRSMISGSTAALRSSVTPSAITAVSSTCSVAPTLGYGRANLVPCSPFGRGQVQTLGRLLDRRAELAQRLEVEVDRAGADVAAAQVGDEGVAEPVQQRAAEQDRDPAGPGVHVDLVGAGALDVGRVEDQLAVLGAVGDLDAVQAEQPADHLDVADLGHVEQPAGRCRPAVRRPSPWRPGSSRRERGSALRAEYLRVRPGRRRSTQPPARVGWCQVSR